MRDPDYVPLYILRMFKTTGAGYRFFCPDGQGYYTASNLREIANYLDKVNAECDKKVKEDNS